MTFILFPVHGPIRHVEAPGCSVDWKDIEPFTPGRRCPGLGWVGTRWWAWSSGGEPNPHGASLGYPGARGDILVSWDLGNGWFAAEPGDEATILRSVGVAHGAPTDPGGDWLH